MNFLMTQWKIIRAYLRPHRAYPLARQKAACEAVASRLGLDVVWYIEGEEAGDRDLWLRQIRDDEVALISRLDLLVGSRKEVGGRPVVEYAAKVVELSRRPGLAIEASTGIRSDKKDWTPRVKACADLIAQGRKLTSEDASNMARKSHRGRKPAIKKQWDDPSMSEEKEALRVIWRSRSFANDDARYAALPEDARTRLGSASSARKVLGPISDTPSKAGRPRKSKRGKSRKT